jgi:hypothetical protein
VVPSAAPPDHVATARQFAIDYMAYWSSTNAVTDDAVSAFYQPIVRFYGRLASLDEVIAEKRRFVARWPVRDYATLPETVQVACNPEGSLCRVAALFAFRASDPGRGRRSEGTGRLELRVSFEDGRPRIVSETSRILARGSVERGGFEEMDD